MPGPPDICLYTSLQFLIGRSTVGQSEKLRDLPSPPLLWRHLPSCTLWLLNTPRVLSAFFQCRRRSAPPQSPLLPPLLITPLTRRVYAADIHQASASVSTS